MKAVIVAFAALAHVSAAHGQAVAPAAVDRTSVTVTVRWYKSKPAVVAACKRLGAWPALPTEQVMRHPAPGCAEVQLERAECVVHALRPERLDDARTATLGHEVLHCLWGSYHD